MGGTCEVINPMRRCVTQWCEVRTAGCGIVVGYPVAMCREKVTLYGAML